MDSTWQEVWSVGSGRTRTYCGITRTEEGFAVDVFHGDTCVEASVFATHEDARRAAAACASRYQKPEKARRALTIVTGETVSELTGRLTAEMPACSAR